MLSRGDRVVYHEVCSPGHPELERWFVWPTECRHECVRERKYVIHHEVCSLGNSWLERWKCVQPHVAMVCRMTNMGTQTEVSCRWMATMILRWFVWPSSLLLCIDQNIVHFYASEHDSNQPRPWLHPTTTVCRAQLCGFSYEGCSCVMLLDLVQSRLNKRLVAKLNMSELFGSDNNHMSVYPDLFFCRMQHHHPVSKSSISTLMIIEKWFESADKSEKVWWMGCKPCSIKRRCLHEVGQFLQSKGAKIMVKTFDLQLRANTMPIYKWT